MKEKLRLTASTLAAALLMGCADSDPAPTAEVPVAAAPEIARNPLRNAYFGDLHVHTGLSFDAFIFGVRANPDDAYRYAQGEAIKHPAGYDMQLARPLDFQAVTDHAMYLGMVPAMADPESAVGQHPLAQQMQNATTQQERLDAFQQVIHRLRQRAGEDDLLDLNIVQDAWQREVNAAEAHYKPGEFTTFIAYEYTSSGGEQENLHRNVIFKTSAAPALPFSSLDSRNPEDLWAWMDEQRGAGVEALAIPHNANGSNGLMFELTTFAGEPLSSAYAEQRMRNEPLVEITQVKGTSETHPLLSPNDEWAAHEIFAMRIASDLASKPEGSYVREAYLNGLLMESTQGFNPYRFGLVGASDSHVGAGSFDESNYWAKVGMVDATAQLRGSVPLDEPEPDGSIYDSDPGYFQLWSASGLTGVWAEANTREAIYDALRRKETFATTGPRIRLRFFAGDELSAAGLDDPSVAYAAGVPMGGDLLQANDPAFLVWVLADAQGAPLERVQIVKGWIEDGAAQEAVFDVACAAGDVDGSNHRCPAAESTVDLRDCSYDPGAGATQLRVVWHDPTFRSEQPAFYYVRALETPTCRWSTWDAIKAGVAPRDGLATTIQERAWSSPIWYRPAGNKQPAASN